MGALTFLDVLRSEVARMQSLHPEREGELARAHALILHGQVLPSIILAPAFGWEPPWPSAAPRRTWPAPWCWRCAPRRAHR